MKLNCRPGDVCLIVSSRAGNEGRIVRAVRLATLAELEEVHFRRDMGPAWLLDVAINTRLGYRRPFAFDSCLRPINPPPGTVTTDEVRELYAPKAKEPSHA